MRNPHRFTYIHKDQEIHGMLKDDQGHWIELGDFHLLLDAFDKAGREYIRSLNERDLLISSLRLRVNTLKDAVAAMSRVVINDDSD